MNKEKALKTIFDCAKSYNQNLVNSNLLFISCDKHKNISVLETVFYSSNYLHLTGVVLSKKYKKDILNNENNQGIANQFFIDCLEQRFSIDDFSFDRTGQTELKLKVLPMAIQVNLAAKMYGEYSSFIVHDFLKTDKIIGNTNLCLGFIKKKNSKFYVPNTLLQKDIRDLVNRYERVIAIYKKDVKDNLYGKNIYIAKNVNIEHYKFPDEYQYLTKIK